MKRLPFLLATIFSLLVLAQLIFFPSDIDRSWGLITHVIGIIVLWLMAIVCSRRWHLEGELRKLNSYLEQRVNERTAELRREQRELEDFFDNATEGIHWVDGDGRIIRVNQAELDLLGYPRNEYVGHLITEFHVDETVINDILQRLLLGERLHNYEARLRCRDGSIKHVLVNSNSLVEDGKFIHTRSFMRDITERKLMDEELELRVVQRTQELERMVLEQQQANEQIHEQARLLDLSNDAIMVRDLEDRILYWNKGAEHIYGWTADEMMGQKASELLPVDVIVFEHARNIVLEKGNWRGEITGCTKHAQEVLVEADWTLIYDQQGKPKSILVVSTDITEKRKLEIQTLRSQRMESIGTLAGGIAHDLNNVLTPLLICIELLKDKITDAEGQNMLDNLEANVQRGAKLVKQVLVFGRGIDGARIPIQLASLVQEIGQIIRETFPKSVALETHSVAGLWTVTGDATQLHQILLNLCVNARDAMPDGGRLSIKMENLMLDETLAGMNPEARSGPYVVINVADTGTGIPKEIRDRIFDPFFTTKAPDKGTGLGLSTCFGIVKSHGGFITVYSEVGRGSNFKVYLPANTAPAAPESLAMEPPQLLCGHGELVLVVDDEGSIREVAQRTLEHFSYRVLTAFDGMDAVSIYRERQHEIAVVITDMVMPIMDGPATIIALQAINPKVRIIGTSGLDSQDGMAKAKDVGVIYFIRKPYTAEVLLQTLHEALQKL
jgi:two-component system cell cycle sensor histidine kinase/response regulator CckA